MSAETQPPPALGEAVRPPTYKSQFRVLPSAAVRCQPACRSPNTQRTYHLLSGHGNCAPRRRYTVRRDVSYSPHSFSFVPHAGNPPRGGRSAAEAEGPLVLRLPDHPLTLVRAVLAPVALLVLTAQLPAPQSFSEARTTPDRSLGPLAGQPGPASSQYLNRLRPAPPPGAVRPVRFESTHVGRPVQVQPQRA